MQDAGHGDQHRPAGPAGTAHAPEPGSAEGPQALVPARREPPEPDVDHPGKLLRIGAMVQRMLHEIRDLELDTPGRQRLVDIYHRTLDELCGILSDELREELASLLLHRLDGDPPPSQSELQLIQAQLAGWLEGLFQGIQASIASQQLAAQQQLAQLRQRALERGETTTSGPPGQYL